jgi:hypothetical protein
MSRIRHNGCYLRLRGAGVVSERHGVASNVVEALVAKGVLVVEQTGCRIPEYKTTIKISSLNKERTKGQKKLMALKLKFNCTILNSNIKNQAKNAKLI